MEGDCSRWILYITVTDPLRAAALSSLLLLLLLSVLTVGFAHDWYSSVAKQTKRDKSRLLSVGEIRYNEKVHRGKLILFQEAVWFTGDANNNFLCVPSLMGGGWRQWWWGWKVHAERTDFITMQYPEKCIWKRVLVANYYPWLCLLKSCLIVIVFHKQRQKYGEFTWGDSSSKLIINT